MHFSCPIWVQTVRDSIKELKKLIDNAFLCRYLTYNDFEQTINVIPTSHVIDEVLPIYKS
jgi:hypothetical protein